MLSNDERFPVTPNAPTGCTWDATPLLPSLEQTGSREFIVPERPARLGRQLIHELGWLDRTSGAYFGEGRSVAPGPQVSQGAVKCCSHPASRAGSVGRSPSPKPLASYPRVGVGLLVGWARGPTARYRGSPGRASLAARSGPVRLGSVAGNPVATERCGGTRRRGCGEPSRVLGLMAPGRAAWFTGQHAGIHTGR